MRNSFHVAVLLPLVAGLPSLFKRKPFRPLPHLPAQPRHRKPTPGDFVDITQSSHVLFNGEASHTSKKYLIETMGNGTFEEVGLPSEMAVDGDGRTFAGMGIDFQDYNNDGLPDMVITDLANQKYALYKNNGDGSFSYDSYVSGIGGMTLL